MDFAIGGLAAMGATILSNPLDVLKTRKQLQGELKPRGQHEIYYKRAVQSAFLIAKTEGVLALQKGLAAALMTQGVRNSIKLGSYQFISNKGFICNTEKRPVFYKSLLASAVAGAAGAFFASPFFIITTRMQSRAAQKIAVGHQHEQSGVAHAFKRIYAKHGTKGLWRGACANVTRTIVGASAQLTTFSLSKDKLRQYELFQYSTLVTAFVASILSGCVQTIFQTPFDLVSIRLNNQNVGKGELYKGMRDCFMKTLKYEGFLGLYKGIGVNYMKLSRHTTACLVFWEILKDLHGSCTKNDHEKDCFPNITSN